MNNETDSGEELFASFANHKNNQSATPKLKPKKNRIIRIILGGLLFCPLLLVGVLFWPKKDRADPPAMPVISQVEQKDQDFKANQASGNKEQPPRDTYKGFPIKLWSYWLAPGKDEKSRRVLNETNGLTIQLAVRSLIARIGKDIPEIGPAVISALRMESFANSKKKRWEGMSLLTLECIAALGPMARESLPDLHEALREEDVQGSKSDSVRVAIAYAISCVDPSELKGRVILEHGLVDSEPNVRQLAAYYLVKLKHREAEAIAVLRSFLKPEASQSKDRLFTACVMLYCLGLDQETCWPVVVSFLEVNDSAHRLGAMYALWRMGPSAIPKLLPLLKNSESTVRAAAALGIAGIGPDAAEAVAALIPLLTDPDHKVVSTVAFALGCIGPQAKAAVSQLKTTSMHTERLVRANSLFALALIEADPAPHVLALCKHMAFERPKNAADDTWLYANSNLVWTETLILLGPHAISGIEAALRDKNIPVNQVAEHIRSLMKTFGIISSSS